LKAPRIRRKKKGAGRGYLGGLPIGAYAHFHLGKRNTVVSGGRMGQWRGKEGQIDKTKDPYVNGWTSLRTMISPRLKKG